MQQDLAINNELKKITSLLQDSRFALEMAKNQDAAYYISQGQTVPAFLPDSADTSTIVRSLKEEKIATNIAAFYALECGIGALVNQKGGSPGEWLNKLTAKQLDSTEILILNRFANATWKAGQPFRGLDRITRTTFTCFDLLTPEEIEKDWVQIKAAAVKLSKALLPL